MSRNLRQITRPKIPAMDNRMDNRTAWDLLGNERGPRTLEDSPISSHDTELTTFRNAGLPANFQSENHGRAESQPEFFEDSNIKNDRASIQILPPPTPAIAELFYKILNEDPSAYQEEIHGRSCNLRMHSSVNNKSATRESRYKAFTRLQIAIRTILCLMLLFIIICCVAWFIEQRSISRISVTLISMLLALGCFAIYILLMFYKICTYPCCKDPDFDF